MFFHFFLLLFALIFLCFCHFIFNRFSGLTITLEELQAEKEEKAIQASISGLFGGVEETGGIFFCVLPICVGFMCILYYVHLFRCIRLIFYYFYKRRIIVMTIIVLLLLVLLLL